MTAPEATKDPVGYYGLPVIHQPHWRWLIACYFFLAGISGAAAVLSAIARFVDRRDGPRVARAATYVSTAALMPCPWLLILDLGRPARFFNMLRVIRPSSPMSIGSWSLAFFGAVSSVAASLQFLVDVTEGDHANHVAVLDRLVRFVSPVAAFLGILVSGYTGALLSATAVPIWSKRPALLGPLLLSSAVSSGSAAVALVLTLREPAAFGAETKIRRFEALAVMAESVLLTIWFYALGSTAKPLVDGRLGRVLRYVVVGAGLATPQLLSALAETSSHQRSRQLLSRIASVATLVGGFALRYVVVQAGRDSADDPDATFRMTSG